MNRKDKHIDYARRHCIRCVISIAVLCQVLNKQSMEYFSCLSM